MSHRTVAQVRLARVIPSMHVHLCVALWLFSLHPSPSSTLFRCSPSSPSRCLPQSSTRGSGPTPCATSAWGPWPLLTTRHPLHKSGRIKMRRIPGEQNLADHLTKGKAWHQIETLIRGVGGIMKMSGDGKGGDERKKWQGG